MSNVWATMPYVQLSHRMFVICINNRHNHIFSEMSLRDVMELPMSDFRNSGLKNDVMILVTIMISLTPVSNRVLPIS